MCVVLYWQLRTAKYTKEEELESLFTQEEGIIYSQALHFCNRMVYLKVPLDTSRGMPFMPHGESSASSHFTPRYVSESLNVERKVNVSVANAI